MPNGDEILQSLSTISNSWGHLAVLWHACFAAMLAALLLRWRPSKQIVGALLIPPLLSVSVLAWSAGNPFNGAIFALLSVVFA